MVGLLFSARISSVRFGYKIIGCNLSRGHTHNASSSLAYSLNT